MKPYTVAIAGSTEHTLLCAEVLQKNPNFSVSWTLTPIPKPIGRKKIMTENPLHTWSQQHHVPNILVSTKINAEIQAEIETTVDRLGKPDFLLVVDFGYLIPNWLLELPAIAPLNIHPSHLPKWRGSSPGQFVLLYGEKMSAVTLMEMNAGLDTGPIIHQEPFSVDPSWTQTEYYTHSFDIISKILPEKMIEFARLGKKMKQPEILPTPIARRLKKEDGFVEWSELQAKTTSNPLLTEMMGITHCTLAEALEQATRAFAPWPGLWTVIPTRKGEKRMQILKGHVENDQEFILDSVKIEGQDVAKWSQVKNQI